MDQFLSFLAHVTQQIREGQDIREKKEFSSWSEKNNDVGYIMQGMSLHIFGPGVCDILITEYK